MGSRASNRAREEFRIGVTGHRADRLAGADLELLRGRIREIFAHLERSVLGVGGDGVRLADSAPVRLAVVSPLAEGADRLVAQEGVAAGFPLHCPLPFNRDEYAQDFATEASDVEYRGLLRQATTVVELPGSRQTPSDADAAYVAVGQAVLDESDVLIAIWDGQQARGAGGTEQVVQQALDRAIPVIWIAVDPPHTAAIAGRAADGIVIAEPLDTLDKRLRSGLGRPR